MSTPSELVRALGELERALADFSTAYEAWLREGGDDAALRALLDTAEQQLDAAREALARVQDSLRA